MDFFALIQEDKKGRSELLGANLHCALHSQQICSTLQQMHQGGQRGFFHITTPGTLLSMQSNACNVQNPVHIA